MQGNNNDYNKILQSLLTNESKDSLEQIVKPEYPGIKIPTGTQQGVCAFCGKQTIQPCNGTLAWHCINLNRVMQVIQSKLDNNFLLSKEESTLLNLVRK
jgi:hypothetical protein